MQGTQSIFSKPTSTQEDFLNDLPNIGHWNLIQFLDNLIINPSESDITLFNRIIANLTKTDLYDAQQISTRINLFFQKLHMKNNNLISLHCETDRYKKSERYPDIKMTMEPPVFINKILLISSSRVLKEKLEKNETEISLPPNIKKEPLPYLKEFLETGEIKKLHDLSNEIIKDLNDLAAIWGMFELINYLWENNNFFISKASVDHLLNMALDFGLVPLFNKCIEFKFSSEFVKINVEGHNVYVNAQSIECIYKKEKESMQKLDEMCSYFEGFKKSDFFDPTRFKFVLRHQGSTGIFYGEFYSESFLNNYPQSFIERITRLEFVYSWKEDLPRIRSFASKCKNLEYISLSTEASKEHFEQLNLLCARGEQDCPKFKGLELSFKGNGILGDYSHLAKMIVSLRLKDLSVKKIKKLTKGCINLKSLFLEKVPRKLKYPPGYWIKEVYFDPFRGQSKYERGDSSEVVNNIIKELPSLEYIDIAPEDIEHGKVSYIWNCPLETGSTRKPVSNPTFKVTY